MTALHQEIVPNPEHEAKEADRSSQESSCEMTKELFRRELSPSKDESITPEAPKTPTSRTPSKQKIKSPSAKNESATKKKSNSGIPLRLKPVSTVKPAAKGGTYRHVPPAPVGPVINRNTLEVQFMNNKKRLLQLHAELQEKQRPLLEMHKSLLRTKKQLEEMGKKVVLEDLKVISLKTDETKTQMDGGGENPAAETAMNLRNSIEYALDACAKVCKKCFVERDHVVKILESASTIGSAEIEAEVEEILKEKEELEKSVESTIKESEKKIDEVIDNWQKTVKATPVNQEMVARIADLEETVKQQQKLLQEGDDNFHSLSRKFEERKIYYEKTISEMQDKYNKLEEELKKEKKNANDNLMKSRTLRSKLTELETKTKESEVTQTEVSQKLKQLQEQLRRKEVQWIKEREDFKKNEALMQQKFIEKQSQFDTRLQDMEKLQKTTEIQHQNFFRNFETQLEIKDQEFTLMEKEKDALAEKTRYLEGQVEEMRMQLEEKEKELDELSLRSEKNAIEYKPVECNWSELVGYKQKVSEAQSSVDQLNEQVSKMQNSLKTHAKLAAALKLEKDKAMEYSTKLREVLQEARDELQYKTKIIYKIHEKLVIRESENEKLKKKLKEYESSPEFSSEKWNRNKCQICMTSMIGDKTDNSSCAETEVGKCSVTTTPQYVSESLIGMSVKKVDHLRARLDNLKKMKLPRSPTKKTLNAKYSWPHHPRDPQPISNHLRKQIELRGKLYQILQKHADQSCEDFINLLKLTMSKGGKGAPTQDELKPSNMKNIDETIKNFLSSNLKITESISAVSHFGQMEFGEIYDRANETTPNSDTDEFAC